MNKIRARFHHLSWALIISFILTSCSTLSKLNPMNYLRNRDTKEKPVSRAEYNELLKKYENLLSKQVPISPAENKKDEKDKKDVEELEKLINQVLVLKEKSKSSKSKKAYNAKTVRKELKGLIQLKEKIDQKKFGDALLLVKELEGSQVEQVRAQARFFFAEVLFLQKEFDLAMQIYEEVLIKMTYSAYARESLERLVVCTEKLNRESKNTYYQSMLKKFSGSD